MKSYADQSRSWYNDTKYSELTLKLSDGREISVHKVVVCNNNACFNSLCGVGSQFAVSRSTSRSRLAEQMLKMFSKQESGQKLVTLREDDLEAVEDNLRKIYGCILPEAEKKPWRFWFNLTAAADKYLEVDMSKEVKIRFMITARKEEDANAVFDIIQAIKTETSHLEDMVEFAEGYASRQSQDPARERELPCVSRQRQSPGMGATG